MAVRYNARVQHQSAAPPDFHASNDALVARREALNAELAMREKARGAIAAHDPVTRAIAAEFQRDEEHAARMAHVASLGHLVMSFPDGYQVPGASPRVHAAFARARAQGNYSALEALERELDRDREEEETALVLALMDA